MALTPAPGPFSPRGPFGPFGPIGPIDPRRFPIPPQSFDGVIRVRRPVDGLVVDVVLSGVLRIPGAAQVSGKANGTSRVILRLPGQHIGEEAYTDPLFPPPGGTAPPPRAALAASANLVFALPAGVTLPLDVDALLAACSKLALVPTRALPAGFMGATQIEAPWRLNITPNDGGFVHAAAGATNGRMPLWHSRLVPERIAAFPARGRTSQPVAIVAFSQRAIPATAEFPTGLNSNDRDDIVALSNGSLTTKAVPAQARNLLVTPLGATLDCEGHWPPGGTRLRDWRHRATAGRDSYVRVIRDGFLAPFGHRASYVRVTERSVVPNAQGRATALLRTRAWYIVTEPKRTFLDFSDPTGRAFPFQEVELLTLVTPDQPVATAKLPGGQNGEIVTPQCVWIFAGPSSPTPFLFDVLARDGNGKPSRFRVPMMFTTPDPANLQQCKGAYNNADPSRRHGDLAGAEVLLAKPADGKPETTRLHLHDIGFAVDVINDPHPIQPRFDTFEVAIPGGEEFTGARRTGVFRINTTYAAAGFQPQNQAGLFLEATQPVQLFAPGGGGRTESAGGLATPAMKVAGIAREVGAIAGKASDVVNGVFDAAAHLGDIKLLGVVSLNQLVDGAMFLEDLPRIAREVTAEGVTARMGMKRNSVKGFDLSPFSIKPADTGATAPDDPASKGAIHFRLDSTVTVKPSGSIDGTKVDADLYNAALIFSLGAMGTIRLVVEHLGMAIRVGEKPELTLDFAPKPVQFTGALGYIQKLLDLVPASAFSDPPSIDVSSSGVAAGYSLALPPLPLGALTVSNVGLAAMFRLPFVGGRPSLQLDFATRDRPFSILVALLGGGGFFGVEMDTGGIVAVEGSLEAHAGIAINLGVAAGSVNARLGIYFRYELQANKLTLEAFFEVHGEMDVLGLISCSITVHVGLDAAKDSGAGRVDLYGTATITVEIEFAFFSKSVHVSCTRRFAGSNADPVFAELFGPSEWQNYVAAFD